MPLAVDEELAVIFREMRRASHLDQHQLSDQLRTPVAVLEALETGTISALPNWPETIRVVNAYTRMLGLDPRPILRRIRSQMDAAAAAPQPKEIRPAAPEPSPPPARPPVPPSAAPKVQPMPMPPGAAAKRSTAREAPAQPAPRPMSPKPQPSSPPPRANRVAPGPEYTEAGPDADMVVDGEPGLMRRTGRRLVKWIFVLALCAALGYAISHVVRNPQLIVDAVAGLPEPIPSAARLIRDIVATSPGRKAPAEGADAQPQKGKSDRLPQEQAPAVR